MLIFNYRFHERDDRRYNLEECLKDINEQIVKLRKMFFELKGASLYTLNFSNYTTKQGNQTKNEIGAKSLSNKCNKMYEYITSLEKFINEL